MKWVNKNSGNNSFYSSISKQCLANIYVKLTLSIGFVLVICERKKRSAHHWHVYVKIFGAKSGIISSQSEKESSQGEEEPLQSEEEE